MKFVKYTAILGAVLTVLGFGTAEMAKVNGARWDGREIQNQSMAIPDVLGRHHFGREERISEDAYMGEWIDDATLRFPVVNELSVEQQRGSVTVTAGEAEEILIICDSLKTRREEVLVYQEDDEMKLRIGRMSQSEPPQSEPTVKIVLPRGYQFQDAEFKIAGGSCSVLELAVNELSLQVAAGNMVVQNGETYEADFECAAGSISYTGQIMEEADVDCVAGNILLELRQEKEDFNYEAESTGGEIQIGDTALSGVLAEKELDYDAAREMKLQCAGGQIQVKFTENGM